MFKKKGNSSPKTEKVDTFVGKGTEFKGNLFAQGIVRVDGKVEGDITTSDNLIIGEEGKIYANIKGKSITIAGEVHGNVDCSDNLEILSTGKLIGDVKVSNLFIDEGAVFDGNCEMKQHSTEQNKNKGDKKAS